MTVQFSARTQCSIGVLLAVAASALACGGGGGSDHDGPPYSVTGTIYAAAGSAIDSDTNDTSAAFASNDTADTAQAIGNPVALGGHLNRPGAGPPGVAAGRTTAAGDLADWFRVSLARRQVIRLQSAGDDTGDLDLELRHLDQSLAARSATASQTEEIEVPATGDYYVVALVASGFSNYTLTIGRATAGAAADSAEFVPGQVVVSYRDARRAQGDGPARARRVGMRHVSGDPDGPMLFAAETVAERRAAFQALGLALTPEMRGQPDARGSRSEGDDTRRITAALRRRSEIRSADLNYLRRASAIPTDEFYPYQWHYDQINLPQAWDVVSPNSGVIVAVVDTGVRKEHPDLTGQLVDGFDFISDPAIANDGGGCDGDPEDPGDLAPGGSTYHGTHVSGTIAAHTTFTGSGVGVAGAAWNARVMPLRVLGVGGGTDADIMEALRYAAGRTITCGGVQEHTLTPARIVNMSLSGPGFSQTFQNLITDLRQNDGMIFVAAAGNGASTQPEYPASFAGVISVSAVGPTRTLAPYSNFGATIDVAAPGGDFQRDVDGNGFPDGVFSTFFSDDRGPGYAFYQGTSMATAHVSGVFALMLGKNGALTPSDIDNALNGHEITEPIGSSQLYGNGLIDAARAVNFAAQGGGGATVVDPVLRIDPDGLNFGFLSSELHLSASNGGNDQQPLTVTSVTFSSDDGAAWLTMASESIDASGLGTYRATVDRTGLADGLYTGTIRFTSDHNDVDVDVLMQVGTAANAHPDAGHHYILLVDPQSLKTAAEVQANAADGAYAFRFDGVNPGNYLLVAGTDSDGDHHICDEGEACGAFPTTETVQPIAINANRSDVRFTTGFAASPGVAATGATRPADGYSTIVGE
jgi:serine protease